MTTNLGFWSILFHFFLLFRICTSYSIKCGDIIVFYVKFECNGCYTQRGWPWLIMVTDSIIKSVHVHTTIIIVTVTNCYYLFANIICDSDDSVLTMEKELHENHFVLHIFTGCTACMHVWVGTCMHTNWMCTHVQLAFSNILFHSCQELSKHS